MVTASMTFRNTVKPACGSFNEKF